MHTLTMEHSAGAADRLIRRRYAADGRVRSGCLTCKSRKKKCDGQASAQDGRCRSCIRLGLVCEQQPLRKVPPLPPRKRVKVRGEGGPDPALSESRNASGSPAGATPPQDDGGDDSASQQTTSSASDSPGDPACDPAPSRVWGGLERILLRYFLDHVAPICGILQQDGTRFSSVLLPMAFIDTSLLHALFSYASAHLAHFDGASAPTIPVTAQDRLEFNRHVTRGLAGAITRNAVSETTVASALVTSTAEAIGGDTTRWLLHLEGAGHLINHLGPSKLLQTADGTFLLRYFAYHDIMASLSTRRRTMVDGVYWVQDINTAVRSCDSFVGLGHHIIGHLAEACNFIVDTEDISLSSCPDLRAREILRAEDMAQALRLQDLHIEVDPAESHTDALIHHAEAFRFAALFYIYRHLLRFADAGAVYRLRMQDCVSRILHHVAQIPSNLALEIGLLFPLFMTGIGAGDDAGTMEYVRGRLKGIETWTRFRHVARARELLQMLWDSGRTDWEAMLQELDWNLSLA